MSVKLHTINVEIFFRNKEWERVPIYEKLERKLSSKKNLKKTKRMLLIILIYNNILIIISSRMREIYSIIF